MPELNFQVDGVEAVPNALVPTLALKLRISANENDTQIHSILLRCQIQIEATRRRYGSQEQKRLFDLFGEPQKWGRTLQNMPWAEVNRSVSGFTGSTLVDLSVPCPYDFNIATTKYFDALDNGDVPLCLLFSGTVFYAASHGPLQVGQIPWEEEANFQMPVQIWQEMMDRYYSNCVWLSLQKDVFDRLRKFKSRHASPTWERALEILLDRSEQLEGRREANARVPSSETTT